MLRRMKKRFLDWPLAQKFVFVFSLMTLLSGALMVGALHLGLSVFEEKFYEKSLQELDFFLQRVDGDIQEVDTLTRSIAVDSAVQQQLGELAAADPETATYYYLLTGVRPLLLEKLYQSRQLSSIQYTDLYGHTLTIGEEMPDPAPEHGAQMEALLEQKAGGFALLPPVDADYPYLLCGRAILLLFAWVLLRMARFVTRPIHTLSEAVQVVEGGDFAAARALLPADPAGDEVGALTREFDVMLRQIDTLIHENYEKQLMLQETRYKMLQAQINPHFLYNTLSTLNWLVRAGDREDACRMIVSLGDILRAALSPRDNSTAAAAVQLARSYIDIQQLRYKNRAAFTLTAEGDLEHWYLPHFTLQPLVENAIHYGVEQNETICHVDVCAVAAGGVLTLTLHNTGAPVPPERLAAIRAFTVKPQGHGIGLKNIYERLAMLYRDFTFDFDSTAQAGTTVRIVLRQEERREESI